MPEREGKGAAAPQPPHQPTSVEIAYQDEIAAYSARIAALRNPQHDEGVQRRIDHAYNRFFQELFFSKGEYVTDDFVVPEDFRTAVHDALALCTTTRPISLTGEEVIDRAGKSVLRISAIYGSTGRPDSPKIITVREGGVIIDSFGLETGTSISRDRQAYVRGVADVIIRENKRKGIMKLKSNLGEFAARHSLPGS